MISNIFSPSRHSSVPSEGSVTLSQDAHERGYVVAEGKRKMEVEENSSETPYVSYFAPIFLKYYLFSATVVLRSCSKAAVIYFNACMNSNNIQSSGFRDHASCQLNCHRC